MQAAFRAQNPCLFRTGTKSKRKENAYVFDFDPARTLIIFEEFANNLSPNTSSGRGDVETRKKNIRELLNFFPVIGEDENGELIELDAEKVLSIPRKIKSVEVVRRGFMSNFLFQNINNVFSAPKEVLDIIEQFDPIGEQKPKQNVTLSEEVKKDLGLDENGEVNLDDEYVIGVAADIFGPKLYDVKGGVDEVIAEVQQSEKPNTLNDRLKDFVKNQIVKDVVQTAQDNYGSDMKRSDIRQV